MVRDLNLPVAIVVGPIVRESDGLAMSSRNAYLNPEERRQASALYRSLRLGEQMIGDGERDAARIRSLMAALIARESTGRIDYISIADPGSLRSWPSSGAGGGPGLPRGPIRIDEVDRQLCRCGGPEGIMNRNLAVVVMAAGKGTRMKNPDFAKVMYAVDGKPMIQHVVDLPWRSARTELSPSWAGRRRA